MKKANRHPVQPVEWDEHGVIRFKENAIVRYLLDNGGIDLCMISCLGFSKEDQEQFAQLIGYSVSGAGDLEYVSKRCLRIADNRAEELIRKREELT